MDLLQRGVHTGRALVACLLTALAASACADAGSSDGAATSRVDSAGIEIVVSPDSDAIFARLDTVPDLSLGGIDVEGPTQFSDLGRILSLGDGSIWVRDGSTQQVRVFERDGTHRMSLGGRGDGPGEFRSAVLLGKDPADSVVVGDARLRKVVWYSPDGELARSAALGGRSPNFHGVLPGGRLVGELPVGVNPSTLTKGDLLGDTTAILVWDSLEAEPRELAALPSAPVLFSNMAGAPIPFRARPGVAVDERVFATAGSAYAIQVFSTDGLLARYELRREPRPVTQEAEDAHRDALEGRGPEDFVTTYLEAMEDPRVPEVLPAYDGLVIGEDGSIWASEWSPPSLPSSTMWHVYGSDGVFEGAVEIPGDFELHVASSDAVLGVWRDDLDVEHVRRYRLIRP